MTGFSDAWNKEVAGYAPPNVTTLMLSSDASDGRKVAALKDADFLMLHPGTLSEPVMRAATRLKFVQLLRAGYDLVDVKLLEELGIGFANLGDATSGIVADLTVLLMLAVYRHLPLADQGVKAGRWVEPIEHLAAYEMQDKVVGVIGLGNIGRQVARRVQGFGCRVQYHNRRRLPSEEERRLGVTYATLDELCATSDIITLHVPLTKESRHILGRREIALVKPSAIVVNTARGALLDQQALVEALQGRRIAGAGLDVYDPQPPPPGSPLLKLDNVVLTPYVASDTQEKARRVAHFVWRNFQAVSEGRTPEGLILPGRRS